MNPTPCQLLDDYVAHDLIGDDLARFEDHLPSCLPCQQAIGEARAFDALLLAAVTGLEPIPDGLSQRVGQRLCKVRRRRLVAGVAALAASVVVVVLVARFVLRVPAPAPTQQIQAKQEPPLPAVPPAAEPVRVTFRNAGGVLAVPVPSESPNVTLMLVYTDLRRTARAAQDEEPGLSIPERSDP